MLERPNIVFIMPDQLRADFLSAYGASFIHTPNIDALGTHGATFGRAYSPHPVCVPARVSLMTGMNAVETGVLDNGQFLRPDYRACGIRTWPEILNETGYHTVATGKMHFYPWEQRLGFQRRIIAEDKLWGFIQDDYYHFLQARGYAKTAFRDQPEYHENFMALTSPLPWECSVDHFVGQESARWIREYEDDQPFALMVGFPGPHSPYDPAAEFATLAPDDMPEPVPAVAADNALMQAPSAGSGAGRGAGPRSWYAVENRKQPERRDFLRQRAYYAGLVKQIDHEVGCIVQALEQKGILDNTVIIFSSDHGDFLGDHNLQGKNSFYEAACRIPLLVRHPDMFDPARSENLVSLTDVTATILAVAGCPVPGYMSSAALPGLGLPRAGARNNIVGALHNSWMLLEGAWKLSKYAGGGAHLFNLEEDPVEQHNRARDPGCADIFHRMDAELTTRIMRSLDRSNSAQRVYTSSYSSSPDFGRVGWERPYPMPWDRLHPGGN